VELDASTSSEVVLDPASPAVAAGALAEVVSSDPDGDVVSAETGGASELEGSLGADEVVAGSESDALVSDDGVELVSGGGVDVSPDAPLAGAV